MSHRRKSRTLKKMNCNPNVVGKSINKDSCYTNKTITKIKKAFNRNNRSNKIKSTDSQTIYKELSLKIKNCDDESCWLKEFGENERKSLRNDSFSPNKPDEWIKNPVEWLSNFDILNVLKQYEEKYQDFKFIGPSPIDFNSTPYGNNKCVTQDLCTFKLQNYERSRFNSIGVVFNLDKHNQGGSHWVSLFISIKHKLIYYFDSAANDIPKEIDEFVKLVVSQSHNKLKFLTNVPHQHQYENTECGMYSLFFIITMLDESISIRKRISMFSKKRLNDKYIQQFRKKYFN
jgi:hypothetical protein